MVKYRGISVSMISQHDIRKLPEYEPPSSADPFQTAGPSIRSEKDSIASCYVPAYPGAQIWFDYSIENPHPPNAQYFFKLVHNGEVFTSWDCTAKHDYQGRTTFALKYLGTHPQTGEPVIERQAFRFSIEMPSHIGPLDNCVEIRVYRIDHRATLPLAAANVRQDDVLAGENIYHDGFRLVNGGVLGPDDPKRRYKYQLVDPADKPYATIRFFYRPLELLIANGIVGSTTKHSRQSSTTSESSRTSSGLSSSVARTASEASSNRSPTRSENSIRTGSSRPGSPPTDSVAAWLRHHRLQKYNASLGPLSFDTLLTLSDDDLARFGVAAKGARAKLLRELATYELQHPKQVEVAGHDDTLEKQNTAVSLSSEATLSSRSTSTGSRELSKSEYVGYCLGDPQTDPSLEIITKDSIDQLALPAPPGITLSAPPHKTIFNIKNSPTSAPDQTASSAPAQKTAFSTEEIKAASPTKSPKKCRKSLKVKINGAEFELEKDTKRPLSPFTSGGMLRRLLNPLPSSAPAHITAFGPTIDDEVNGMLEEMESGGKQKGKVCVGKTTRADRGGGMLKKILGKRIGRK